jgi:hypothetical protein
MLLFRKGGSVHMKTTVLFLLLLFSITACTHPADEPTNTESVPVAVAQTETTESERCMLDDWIDESDYSMQQSQEHRQRSLHYTCIERDLTEDEQAFVDFYDGYQAEIRALINDMCPTLETFSYETHDPEDYIPFAERYTDIRTQMDAYSLADEQLHPPEIFKMAYRDLTLKTNDLDLFFETIVREDLSEKDDPKLRHAFIQGRKAGEYSYPVDCTVGR